MRQEDQRAAKSMSKSYSHTVQLSHCNPSDLFVVDLSDSHCIFSVFLHIFMLNYYIRDIKDSLLQKDLQKKAGGLDLRKMKIEN